MERRGSVLGPRFRVAETCPYILIAAEYTTMLYVALLIVVVLLVIWHGRSEPMTVKTQSLMARYNREMERRGLPDVRLVLT